MTAKVQIRTIELDLQGTITKQRNFCILVSAEFNFNWITTIRTSFYIIGVAIVTKVRIKSGNSNKNRDDLLR